MALKAFCFFFCSDLELKEYLFHFLFTARLELCMCSCEHTEYSVSDRDPNAVAEFLMPFLASVALVPNPAEFDLSSSLKAFNCLSNEYIKSRHCISDQAAVK